MAVNWEPEDREPIAAADADGVLAWPTPPLFAAVGRRALTTVPAQAWLVTLVIVEGLSFMHGLIPTALALRAGFTVVALIPPLFLLRFGPRLSERQLQQALLATWITATVIMTALMVITPATFATEIALMMIGFIASVYFRPRVVIVQGLLLTIVTLMPLWVKLPGTEYRHAAAWLVIYEPVLWFLMTASATLRWIVNSSIDRLLAAADRDALTGLASLGRLRRACELLPPPTGGTNGGVLLIDLDGFKSVNTLHGHLGGDHALRTVGTALRAAAAPNHVVSRIGGDEFAVLVPAGSREMLGQIATVYREAIRKTNASHRLDGIHLDASIGIAERTPDRHTLPDLLADADAAMYAVKARHKDRTRTFGGYAESPASGPVLRPAPPLPAAPFSPAPATPAARDLRHTTIQDATRVLRDSTLALAPMLAIAAGTMITSRAVQAGTGGHWVTGLGSLALIAAAMLITAFPALTQRYYHLVLDPLLVATLVFYIRATGGFVSPGVALIGILPLALATGRQRLPVGVRVVIPLAVALTPLIYSSSLSAPTTAAGLASAGVFTAISLVLWTTERILTYSTRRSREEAETDTLTGVHNRRAFAAAFERASTDLGAEADAASTAVDTAGTRRSHASGRGHPRFAVVLVDLDNFSTVNNTLGHDAGDRLLRAIAGGLRAATRAGDFLARVGGDEFAVLLLDTDRESAVVLADRLVASVMHVTSATGDPVLSRVTASAGCAMSPEDGRTMDMLLGRADAALQDAKAAGKAHARLVEPSQSYV